MEIKRKIIMVSWFFRYLAWVQAVSVITVGIYQWVVAPYAVPALPEMSMVFVSPALKSQIPSLSDMTASLKAIGVLAYFTPIVAKALLFVFLAVLLTECKRLRIFSKRVLQSIRNSGYVVIVSTLLSFIYSIVTYYLLPDSFPLTGRQLLGVAVYGPIGYSLRYIIVGIFVVFVSWIMSFGLEEEQKNAA